MLCAVKRLQLCPGDYASGCSPLAEHEREVNALRKLNHPCILQYYGSVEDSHTVNIITEYADSGDLQELIRLRSDAVRVLEAVQVLAMFAQLAAAVQHLHEHHILHRDLKPPNVLLTSKGYLKLGDFGVAKEIAGTTKMDQMTCVGSPVYMAPEIVGGEHYGPACDIWSLGVVLYELCTLRKPFQGRSLGEMAMRIMSGSYDPLDGEAFTKNGGSQALGNIVQPLIAQMLVLDAKARANMDKVMLNPAVALYAASSRSCRATVADMLREDKDDQVDNNRQSNDNSKGKQIVETHEKPVVEVVAPRITVQPPDSKPRAGDQKQDLTMLSVKELKQRLKEAGVQLPPGTTEKSELVSALRAALLLKVPSASSSKAAEPPSTAPPARSPSKEAQSPPLGPQMGDASLLSVRELKRQLIEAGVEIPAGATEKSELVTALQKATTSSKLPPQEMAVEEHDVGCPDVVTPAPNQQNFEDDDNLDNLLLQDFLSGALDEENGNPSMDCPIDGTLLTQLDPAALDVMKEFARRHAAHAPPPYDSKVARDERSVAAAGGQRRSGSKSSDTEGGSRNDGEAVPPAPQQFREAAVAPPQGASCAATWRRPAAGTEFGSTASLDLASTALPSEASTPSRTPYVAGSLRDSRPPPQRTPILEPLGEPPAIAGEPPARNVSTPSGVTRQRSSSGVGTSRSPLQPLEGRPSSSAGSNAAATKPDASSAGGGNSARSMSHVHSMPSLSEKVQSPHSGGSQGCAPTLNMALGGEAANLPQIEAGRRTPSLARLLPGGGAGGGACLGRSPGDKAAPVAVAGRTVSS